MNIQTFVCQNISSSPQILGHRIYRITAPQIWAISRKCALFWYSGNDIRMNIDLESCQFRGHLISYIFLTYIIEVSYRMTEIVIHPLLKIESKGSEWLFLYLQTKFIFKLHFWCDLSSNRILFGAKSIGKVQLQYKFGSI